MKITLEKHAAHYGKQWAQMQAGWAAKANAHRAEVAKVAALRVVATATGITQLHVNVRGQRIAVSPEAV